MDKLSAESLLEDGAVTVKGATDEYGIGRTRLYQEMNAGRLPFVQYGSRRLIPRKALGRLLAEAGLIDTRRVA